MIGPAGGYTGILNLQTATIPLLTFATTVAGAFGGYNDVAS